MGNPQKHDVTGLTALLEKVRATGGQSHEPTTNIDVSEALDESEGTTVFELRRLGVPQLYQMQEDAQAIRKKNPSLPLALCLEIAALSLAHVAPVPTPVPVGDLYTAFTNHTALWLRLTSSYLIAFPEILGAGYAQAVVDAKND